MIKSLFVMLAAGIVPFSFAWSAEEISQPAGDKAAREIFAESREGQCMSEGERDVLHRNYAHWREMPDGKRRVYRDRWEHYRHLSPEQRERMRMRYERWRCMTPQQRLMLRDRFRRWQRLSPEERQRIREYRRQAVPRM